MDDARTVWCGNLSDQVTEEILFELFLQAAPLEKVRIPTDKEGRKSNFAFITFKHEVSVNYAQQLLNGTRLFDKSLNVKPRNTNSLERNISRNDYQNNFHQSSSHSEIIRVGQLQQYNYEHVPNTYNENRQVHRNNYREHDDRHRDNHRAYKKHEFHDNRQNDSPRRRNNYSDRKNNFNDNGRNNRRNNRHY